MQVNSQVKTPWSSVGYLTYKRCVEKTTPVLTANLEWKQAGQLIEGEEIIVFDDNLTENKQRYIRVGKVEHNTIEKANCVGVKLSDGDIIYCTPDHSWLVAMSGNKLEWREAKDLLKTKKNGPVFLPKMFGKVWENPDSYKAGYLAAAYDGEGSLDRTNSICFTQVQNSMLNRVEQYLSDFGITDFNKKSRGNKTSVEYKKPRQECFDIKVIGFKNIVRILGQFGSSRLLAKLKDNLEIKPQRMRCNPEDMVQVVDVFDAGEMEISVLSTSHGTHFTAGYPSHNTYARRLNENDPSSKTEEWKDTVNRVIQAAQIQLDCNFTEDEEKRLKNYILGLKGTVAGRFLWQLGTSTVSTLGLSSLQNCAFVVVDNPVRPFTWAMDMLMLGSGVGYNIQRENVNKLPKVRKNFSAPTRVDNSSANFIVPDTREGWVALLGKVLKAAFLSHETGNQTFSYSTQLIRGKGAPIKGFGGTASGPEDLCWGVNEISKILEKRKGKKVRPIDCLDIMNIIGAIVVAGNVRRSAQIAIGDPDDIEFLLSKRWDMGTIPSWRAMSNNSVVCNDISELHDYFWEGYEGKGEPFGLINLELSRKVGRLGETQYPDHDVQGYNP